jgi:hypothetical protein
MFQKYFYIFKTLKKNMWTSGLYQKTISFINCSLNHLKSFVNFNVFHKKGSMCSKNKSTYIYLDFNTQMSFYTIIVLNL